MTAEIKVRRLDPADIATAARWDAFVRNCPDATFFHRSGWQSILRDVFRHDTAYLFAESGGEIVGVLPLAEVKSRIFGHALTSLPFAIAGGVAGSGDAASALEEEAERLARVLGVAHLEYRNTVLRHADWPQQDLYVRFRKELLPDEQANLLAVPRKQRAMIRKGIERNLRSEIDPGVDRFFALYADNVHRHGTPALSKRYFARLKAVFANDCEVLIVTDGQGNPVSGVLSFYFRDEVLPYYAGDCPAARDLAANDFKYWELMRRACARGVRIFDYGRSKLGSGSYSFKKNWGFEAEPLHYEYRLYKRQTVPQNNPANAKYRLFIEAWRRMPRWLVNRIGPHIVRNLG